MVSLAAAVEEEEQSAELKVAARVAARLEVDKWYYQELGPAVLTALHCNGKSEMSQAAGLLKPALLRKMQLWEGGLYPLGVA